MCVFFFKRLEASIEWRSSQLLTKWLICCWNIVSKSSPVCRLETETLSAHIFTMLIFFNWKFTAFFCLPIVWSVTKKPFHTVYHVCVWNFNLRIWSNAIKWLNAFCFENKFLKTSLAIIVISWFWPAHWAHISCGVFTTLLLLPVNWGVFLFVLLIFFFFWSVRMQSNYICHEDARIRIKHCGFHLNYVLFLRCKFYSSASELTIFIFILVGTELDIDTTKYC